jgi:DNA polymerase III subunit beta
MKLVCSKDELSQGLQTVLRSVGARAGIPALSGVLMELSDTDLILTTTDLELTTRVRMGLTGEAGQVLLPARLTAEIVRSLQSDQVELKTDSGAVRVAGGKAKFEIRCMPPEDFPRVEGTAESRRIELGGDDLAAALGQVAGAASRDETRPVLTGVLFEGEGDELSVVATDSYRLSMRKVRAEGVDGIKTLVPARAVVEVGRLAGGLEKVGVELGAAQASFDLGDVTVQSRLIEGEFPAYKQLLPESQGNHLKITKGEFLEALKRVALLAQDATPVFLELGSEGVQLTCTAQGLGEGSEDVDAAYEGEEMRVAFNPSYLEAGISATTTDDVVMDLTDPQRPVLIHEPDDQEFLYLLMPIRVS